MLRSTDHYYIVSKEWVSYDYDIIVNVKVNWSLLYCF